MCVGRACEHVLDPCEVWRFEPLVHLGAAEILGEAPGVEHIDDSATHQKESTEGHPPENTKGALLRAEPKGSGDYSAVAEQIAGSLSRLSNADHLAVDRPTCLVQDELKCWSPIIGFRHGLASK